MKKPSSSQCEKVPCGWYSREALMKKWNTSQSHTLSLIRSGMEQGIVEMKRFRIRRTANCVYPVPHYREKK